MLLTAGKYTNVRHAAKPQPTKPVARRTPRIFVPTLQNNPLMFEEWYWKALREGGFIHEYLRREKALSVTRHRAVRRRLGDVKQNNKSDFRRLAAVPAREYFRWKREDPHFWEDNANLKSYRRDNPDAAVFI